MQEIRFDRTIVNLQRDTDDVHILGAKATREAQQIASSPPKLRQLLRDVEQIEAERAGELISVRGRLDDIKAMVRQHIGAPFQDTGKLVMAVRVLTYLRDPYDAIMDQHFEFGLRDDIAMVLSATRSLNSAG